MNKKELVEIIKEGYSEELRSEAEKIRQIHYGKSVYLRGLIEYTNFCRNGCYYCGLQYNNNAVKRYRLSKESIMDCCKTGYDLGFRTFVIQGGEDPYFTDDIMADIIYSIKNLYPDCAITLSLGERGKETYKAYFNAGADRFLLRHETINSDHYSKLHPPELSIVSRVKCLYALKEIGFQVGAGLMVGSPYQTVENLAEDLIFLQEFQPHMVGIGPFIPQADTVFAGFSQGSLNQTLTILALTRILLPKALMPATTALGTIHPNGREMGLKCGCNVVMPNLSPKKNRKDYALYNNKLATGEEAAEGLEKLIKKIISAGYIPDMSRGDHTEMAAVHSTVSVNRSDAL